MVLRHRSGRDGDELTVQFCADTVLKRDELDNVEIRLKNSRILLDDGKKVPAPLIPAAHGRLVLWHRARAWAELKQKVERLV